MSGKIPPCCVCGKKLLRDSRIVCETVEGIRFGYHFGACSSELMSRNEGKLDAFPRDVLREWAAMGRLVVPTQKAARWLYPEQYR